MFTGIVKDVGIVQSVRKLQNAVQLQILTQLSLGFLDLGASISCSGACLTVTSVSKSECPSGFVFTVDAGIETLKLTNVGSLIPGQKINLEPALRVGDSLGGHQVSGHVDTLGKVLEFSPTHEGFWKLSIGFTQDFNTWVIPKGSIAVSGISLTIATLELAFDKSALSHLDIMIIPHTFDNTALAAVKVGDFLELEFDQNVKTIASVISQMLPHYLSQISSDK